MYLREAALGTQQAWNWTPNARTILIPILRPKEPDHCGGKPCPGPLFMKQLDLRVLRDFSN